MPEEPLVPAAAWLPVAVFLCCFARPVSRSLVWGPLNAQAHKLATVLVQVGERAIAVPAPEELRAQAALQARQLQGEARALGEVLRQAAHREQAERLR